MSARRSTTAVAVACAVLGGLLLAGGTSGDWVREEVARSVAGAELTEERGIAGIEFAAAAVPLGLAAVAAGLPLGLARGRWRRAVGALVGLIGAAGLAVVAAGALAAGDGRTSAPLLAALGAVAVAAGGILAARRGAGQPMLSERFSIDEDAADAEWHWASGEDEQ